MLEEQDRQEIRLIIREETADIRVVQKQHGEDIAELKSDVKDLKQDVTVLKHDVAILKQDVSGLKQDFRKMAISQEVMQDNISLILEILQDKQQKDQKVDSLEETVYHNHEPRLKTLEVERDS